ncbi:unnamed protein product [Thelazia callipaeda]|uniref:Uncharacterized protein n=1 Tax=Thelazia callipaeda TaxID=103827 RepID=A0A0N5CKI3_THECL|nr:unnamed protein product [Thelazia callipaeda]
MQIFAQKISVCCEKRGRYKKRALQGLLEYNAKGGLRKMHLLYGRTSFLRSSLDLMQEQMNFAYELRMISDMKLCKIGGVESLFSTDMVMDGTLKWKRSDLFGVDLSLCYVNRV